MTSAPPRVSLTRIVFLALAVRFAAVLAASEAIRQGMALPDAGPWLELAHRIASGRGAPLPADAPLCPLFLALHIVLFGHAAAALVTQSVLGALACAAVARLGDRLWGPRAGSLAGLAAAADPFLVLAAIRPWPEALAVPLVAGQLLAAVEAGRAAFARETRRAAGWALLAGALGGLGTLNAPAHLLLPAALAAAFAVAWARARQLATPDGWALLAGGLLLFAAAHVSVLATASIHNALAPAGTCADAADRARPAAWHGPDRPAPAEAWRAVREHPARVAENVARVWSPVPRRPELRNPAFVALGLLVYGSVLVLAFLGALRLRRGSILAAILLAAPLYVLAVHAILPGGLRDRLPVEPALLLLAAYRVTGPGEE